VRIWNPRSEWLISDEQTHPALVSDAEYLAVQQITALAMPQDGRAHRYQLTGLLVCELCGRRLQGHWVNQRPGYRCRHGHTTAHPAETDGPRWVYWSQTLYRARTVAHDVSWGSVAVTHDREHARTPDALDDRLLRGLRWQGERGFAVLVGRWKTLRHTTVSPRRTGDIVAAALHLTHFEYKYYLDLVEITSVRSTRPSLWPAPAREPWTCGPARWGR
jgi:hypothetical protein